jgi:GT2 family glycosyltransferase
MSSARRRGCPVPPFDDRGRRDTRGFFDPDFFVYREDADVAWRAQLMGWRCIYTPLPRLSCAQCAAGKSARSARRDQHALCEGRFLLRLKNMTPDLYRRNWLSITARDLVVVGACLLHEHGSLKAFWYLARNWRRVIEKRREIMKRRRVKDDYISSWFSYEPVSRPAPRPTARAVARGRAARS